MRLLLIAIAVLAPAAAGAVAVSAPPVVKAPLATSDNCPRTTSYYAYRDGEPLKPRKLAELPPANMYAAVLHHDGRCEVPIVVKYGVGRR